jgi:hypothetical protein
LAVVDQVLVVVVATLMAAVEAEVEPLPGECIALLIWLPLE